MTPDRSDSSDGEDNLDDEFYLSEDQEDYTERNPSSHKSKSSRGRSSTRSIKKPSKEQSFLSDFDESIISFLDMSFWRKEEICCGIIFKGPNNEVVVSPKLLKPCSCRKSSISSLPKTPSVSTSDNLSVSSSSPPRIEEDTESNASSYNSTI